MPKILRARQPFDEKEEHQVRRLARSRHEPADWILRARIVTRSWDGQRVDAIASGLHCSAQTVRRCLHLQRHLQVTMEQRHSKRPTARKDQQHDTHRYRSHYPY